MTEEKKSAWETETGLPNDIDAWIANPKFGMKDEYAQAVAATGAEGGTMILFDLESAEGEVLGSQGYSIGTGWIVSDDGMTIEHPKRKNVVGSSMYGQLQNRVVKDLGVDMESRGLPTQAKSWDRLGFHWMLQPHTKVGGGEASSLMPVEFLGEKKAAPAPRRAPAAAPAPASDIERTLVALARILDVRAFQERALGLPSVAANDELMASILDEGPEGFWATHRG